MTPRTGSLLALGMMLTLPGCRVSPLTNQIAVGEEAFVVMVGDGTGGQGDLYAGSAAGGPVFQLTFTQDPERLPRLDPTGGLVGFVREDSRGQAWLVVMNLVNSAEREAKVPLDAGAVENIAWSTDGTMLYLRSSAGLYRTPAPPGAFEFSPMTNGSVESMAADSALSVMVGNPPFATVVSCPEQGLCVRTDTVTAPLVVDGRDPLRWTGDSVGYLVDQMLIVRPLGPGRTRRIEWSDPPPGLRTPTHFQPNREG